MFNFGQERPFAKSLLLPTAVRVKCAAQILRCDDMSPGISPIQRMSGTDVPTEETRILVVDDEAAARNALVELLREEGFAVRSAADGFKALGQVDAWSPHLIITDVKMPGLDGLELMKKLRERGDIVGIVVMTAFGSVESAVEAMQQGADDYLTKPVHFPELLVVVRKVLGHQQLRQENSLLKSELSEAGSDGVQWIGTSKASRDLVALIRQVSHSDAPALVLGDHGTGKQLVARALHDWGARAAGPFVTVHCAGLEASVLEAEVFGHVAGALPGTTSARDGALARANGGTLLLNDVSHLPGGAQSRLLRFLQEGVFERLGGSETETSDVRIVAACDVDLQQVETFRDELYYRLNVVTLRVPSLRQRWEDLPALAMHFLQVQAKQRGKHIRGFSDRTLHVLQHFDWKDNVRQLEHCVERAVVLCNEREVQPRHLPREVLHHSPSDSGDAPRMPGSSMADIEKYAILSTLELVRGSTRKAAEILGISPRKIQYRLAEYREAGPSGVPAVKPTK